MLKAYRGAHGTRTSDAMMCKHDCMLPAELARHSTGVCEVMLKAYLRAHGTRTSHRCKPHGQASAASTKQAAPACWLTREPSTDASHTGKHQLQAQSKQHNRAGSKEPSTDASHTGKHQLQAPSKQHKRAGSHGSPAPMQATRAGISCKHRASSTSVLARTGAQHRCKPHGRASAASTKQAVPPCWLKEPSTDASHTGKHQPQALSKQHGRAGSHGSAAPMQATRASSSCKHKASSATMLAQKSPTPMQATRACISCKH